MEKTEQEVSRELGTNEKVGAVTSAGQLVKALMTVASEQGLE